MIKTATQLKAIVRNQTNGNSTKAQLVIRNYIMERFLERLSLSVYKDKIILKGGVLVSSIIGVEKRSTMDLDTTIKNLELTRASILKVVSEIIDIDLDDNVIFEILEIKSIMEDFEYPGIRVMLKAWIDKMHIPLKLDFSTGDIITPNEIEYEYKLSLEDRTISVPAYNMETVIAEKYEAIISRGTANTRIRDFYDIYSLMAIKGECIDNEILKSAVQNTVDSRNSKQVIKDWVNIVKEIGKDENMRRLWIMYQNKFDYASNIAWNMIIESIGEIGKRTGVTAVSSDT